MKMISKKGAAITDYLLEIGFVVVLAVVLFYVFRPTASESGTFFSTEILKTKDSRCIFDMQRALERGQKPTDLDNDGRPDYCDICFSYLNTQGDNKEDNDGDGMPTYCDKDESIDKGRTIVACKSGFTVTDDRRCIEGVAPSAKKVG